MPAKRRVTGSLGESYCCPTSANRLPWPFEIYDSALTRSFRFRIPQPPAPRGRRDRVYRTGRSPRGTLSLRLGQRKLVLFFFGRASANTLQALHASTESPFSNGGNARSGPSGPRAVN